MPVTANMSGFPTTTKVDSGATVTSLGDGGVTGAVVSLFNSAAAGRAPQVARNAFPGPGLRNIDARLSRDFQISEKLRLQFLAEAFNLLNHQNRLSVNTTAYQFSAAGATSTVCSTGSHTHDCISPYTATPFGSTSSTSSTLYGPRQLQFSSKLFF